MSVTQFVWDEEADNVLSEINGASGTQVVYTNETGLYGRLLSQRIDGTTSYCQFDGLGTTTTLTDSSESVIGAAKYTSWGALVWESGTIDYTYKWLGEVGYAFVKEVSDFYVRSRAYEAQIGRWTSLDPMIEGPNGYEYARQNPINRIDPSGFVSTSYIGPIPGMVGNDPPNLNARFAFRGLRPTFLYLQHAHHVCHFSCADSDQTFRWYSFTLDLFAITGPNRVAVDRHFIPVEEICTGGPGESGCCSKGQWSCKSGGDVWLTNIRQPRQLTQQFTDVRYTKKDCKGEADEAVTEPQNHATERMNDIRAQLGRQGKELTMSFQIGFVDEASGSFEVIGGKCRMDTANLWRHPEYVPHIVFDPTG